MKEFIIRLYRAAGIDSTPKIVELDSYTSFFENYSRYESQLGGIPLIFWPHCSSISMPVTLDDDTESRVYKGEQSYEALWETSFKKVGGTKADKIVVDVFDEYSEVMDKLDDIAVEKCSYLPLGVEDCVFLGPFGWLETDIAVLNKMKEQGLPDSSKHELLACLSTVVKEKLFLLTFNDLVFVTRLN